MLDTAAITALLQELPNMPLEEKAALLEELDRLEAQRELDACRDDFLAFCKKVYPNWKEGPHHRHLKPKLHAIAEGIKTRMSVSMPPRFGKSETIAYLFVAWYLGKHPTHHIMMVTHTAALSADFGRKVRNLIDSDVYQKIFPDTKVSKDKSAADNWTTTLGGKYLAIGIGANVAGHGAHLLVADDLCVDAKTKIVALRGGAQNAEDVCVGDYILGHAGFQKVLRKTCSTHAQGIRVRGVVMSAEHPVWTYNRGWVRATDLRATDVLQTISVCDKVVNYAKRLWFTTAQALSARVQHLGNDEAALSKSKSRKLYQLWSQRDYCGAGIRAFCRIFGLSGAVPVKKTHIGPNRQHAGVFRAKLSVGADRNAAKQQDELRTLHAARGETVGTTAGTTFWSSGSANGTPFESSWDVARASRPITEAELGAAPRGAEDFGRLRCSVARVLGARGALRASAGVETATTLGKPSVSGPAGDDADKLSHTLARGYQKTVRALGVFVGVRYAGRVERLDTTNTKFVNFEVQGDNTFFADGLLTHNCSEQAVLNGNPDNAFSMAWEYMQVGPLQRLMPGGRIVMIGTRWSKRDPIGRALEWALNNPDSPRWDEVKFPAIMDVSRDGVNKQVSLWPEQWPVEQLLAKKASMFPQFWAAQYMQAPTSEEGAIIKREWWRTWEREDPPTCEYVMISIDTAYETKNSSDYTAFATWGVWTTEALNYKPQLILLDAWKDRIEFPELKRLTLKHYKEWSPDTVIVEKKAAGAPLIQELRQMGVPVQEFTPTRGNDKRVRLNAVTDLFASGIVWAPATRWAKEVIDEVAEFPNGEHDDYVDVTSQALLRFRQGGFVSLDSDEDGEPIVHRRRQHAYY